MARKRYTAEDIIGKPRLKLYRIHARRRITPKFPAGCLRRNRPLEIRLGRIPEVPRLCHRLPVGARAGMRL